MPFRKRKRKRHSKSILLTLIHYIAKNRIVTGSVCGGYSGFFSRLCRLNQKAGGIIELILVAGKFFCNCAGSHTQDEIDNNTAGTGDAKELERLLGGEIKVPVQTIVFACNTCNKKVDGGNDAGDQQKCGNSCGCGYDCNCELPESISGKLENAKKEHKSFVQLCDNLFCYFGESNTNGGVFQSETGIRIGILGGIERIEGIEDHGKSEHCFFDKNDIVSIEQQLGKQLEIVSNSNQQEEGMPTQVGDNVTENSPRLDVLVTYQWPRDIDNRIINYNSNGKENVGTSGLLAELIGNTRPQYVFSTQREEFYEREPFYCSNLSGNRHTEGYGRGNKHQGNVRDGNNRIGGGIEEYTRFIGLGGYYGNLKEKLIKDMGNIQDVGDKGNLREGIKYQKWYYAVHIRPATKVQSGECEAPPVPTTITSCPFSKEEMTSESIVHTDPNFNGTAAGIGSNNNDFGINDDIDSGRVKRMKLQDGDSVNGESNEGFIRRPGNNYVCKICKARAAHFIHDCPLKTNRLTQQQQQQQMSGGDSMRWCWFCLSNPNLEKQLIIDIGQQVYIAAAKGGIPLQPQRLNDSGVASSGTNSGLQSGHVLIIPIDHYNAGNMESNQLVSPVPMDLLVIEKFKTEIINQGKTKYGIIKWIQIQSKRQGDNTTILSREDDDYGSGNSSSSDQVKNPSYIKICIPKVRVDADKSKATNGEYEVLFGLFDGSKYFDYQFVR
ncbi:CWF19-like protein 1 [Zancudomyces culisetae]|uniref:CWF19-like protein 1 n=1 Tax=Zancudomyces culisetae TaxID=1213189 RepID=A0A1R1PZ39_ZANCU|nr:CWF19-like protein 1 [Zancudomyces culisetae]|eukprot:OMH86232.1 CWF19-like protein 1 [Zancudomyces culisetae]